MLAFAGNSILCRMALATGSIDPASFTTIRLLSGAATLLLVRYATGSSDRASGTRHGSWLSALMLFLYAAGFSYAYIDLGAGTGALILFGFVQATMIAITLLTGARPSGVEWLGWVVATFGLAWLMLPGATAPSAGGAFLMAVAGVAWGVYSVLGQRESAALASTAANFTRSLVPAALLVLAGLDQVQISSRGALLAVASGAVTSGVGYVIWYIALNYLASIRAALVQLSVPAIAASGGVLFLAEPIDLRLLTAGSLILGGICVALLGKSKGVSTA